MWILLQFISGSIQKNPVSIQIFCSILSSSKEYLLYLLPQITNFLPVFRLFDLLYPELEPLKLPDINKSSMVRHLAPICVWIHLMKKARVENMNITRPLPIALKNHYE